MVLAYMRKTINEEFGGPVIGPCAARLFGKLLAHLSSKSWPTEYLQELKVSENDGSYDSTCV